MSAKKVTTANWQIIEVPGTISALTSLKGADGFTKLGAPGCFPVDMVTRHLERT
jgi:hypothetical protein